MDRRRAAAALLALAACLTCANAAPTTSNQTTLDLYDSDTSNGCYYNFQHYGEGDRIMTNEPCLNCTCHHRMLMCYLRVCPFTKAIGQDCTVEKRADQCCPIVTCPDVPVDLLTSTTNSPAEYGTTGVGRLDKYGCSINNKYFPEGSKVPPSPNKPCEHCYCIRNMTTCVMQECTLHVDGCTPIYLKDVCCPVRYSCDHAEDEIPLLDDMTTTVRPTPGFLLTTTTMASVTQIPMDCVHDDQIFPDGALIKTEKACEHCYCMKGDIVCVVQECGTPMENEGKNCTSMPPREGQCCPDTYICEGDNELQTDDTTTLVPPRRAGVEGSGYRHEDQYTQPPIIMPEPEGSGFEGSGVEGSGEEDKMEMPSETEDVATTTGKPLIIDDSDLIVTTEPASADESVEKSTTEPDKGENTVPSEEEHTTHSPMIGTTMSDTITEVDKTQGSSQDKYVPEVLPTKEEPETERNTEVPFDEKKDVPETEQKTEPPFEGTLEEKPDKEVHDIEHKTEAPQSEDTLHDVTPEKDTEIDKTPSDEKHELPSSTTTPESYTSSLPDSTGQHEDQYTSTTAQAQKEDGEKITLSESSSTESPVYTTHDSEPGTTEKSSMIDTQTTAAFDEKESKTTTVLLPDDVNVSETVKPTEPTEAAIDLTTASDHVKTPESTGTASDESPSITTSKYEIPETTSVNPIENEIQEEISPEQSPGIIPGEGNCLVNGITYGNESIVPSMHKCQSNCRCMSSIVKCDPIVCSGPPENMLNCQSIYDSADTCCPTFVCDNGKETIPPQSHSQMAGTESPSPQDVSCDGEQCKPQQQIPLETSPQCLSTDCTESDKKDSTPISEPAATKQPEVCLDGTCISSSEGCKGDDCQIPPRKDDEPCKDGSCDGPSQQPCEGTSCTSDSSPKDGTSDCGNDGSCVQTAGASPACEGKTCLREPAVQPSDFTKPDLACSDGACKDEPSQEQVPQSECSEESCSKKEEAGLGSEDETSKPSQEPYDLSTEPAISSDAPITEVPVSPIVENGRRTESPISELPESQDSSTKIPEYSVTESQKQDDLVTDSQKTGPESDKIDVTDTPIISASDKPDDDKITDEMKTKPDSNDNVVTDAPAEFSEQPATDITKTKLDEVTIGTTLAANIESEKVTTDATLTKETQPQEFDSTAQTPVVKDPNAQEEGVERGTTVSLREQTPAQEDQTTESHGIGSDEPSIKDITIKPSETVTPGQDEKVTQIPTDGPEQETPQSPVTETLPEATEPSNEKATESIEKDTKLPEAASSAEDIPESPMTESHKKVTEASIPVESVTEQEKQTTSAPSEEQPESEAKVTMAPSSEETHVTESIDVKVTELPLTDKPTYVTESVEMETKAPEEQAQDEKSPETPAVTESDESATPSTKIPVGQESPDMPVSLDQVPVAIAQEKPYEETESSKTTESPVFGQDIPKEPVTEPQLLETVAPMFTGTEDKQSESPATETLPQEAVTQASESPVTESQDKITDLPDSSVTRKSMQELPIIESQEKITVLPETSVTIKESTITEKSEESDSSESPVTEEIIPTLPDSEIQEAPELPVSDKLPESSSTGQLEQPTEIPQVSVSETDSPVSPITESQEMPSKPSEESPSIGQELDNKPDAPVDSEKQDDFQEPATDQGEKASEEAEQGEKEQKVPERTTEKEEKITNAPEDVITESNSYIPEEDTQKPESVVTESQEKATETPTEAEEKPESPEQTTDHSQVDKQTQSPTQPIDQDYLAPSVTEPQSKSTEAPEAPMDSYGTEAPVQPLATEQQEKATETPEIPVQTSDVEPSVTEKQDMAPEEQEITTEPAETPVSSEAVTESAVEPSATEQQVKATEVPKTPLEIEQQEKATQVPETQFEPSGTEKQDLATEDAEVPVKPSVTESEEPSANEQQDKATEVPETTLEPEQQDKATEAPEHFATEKQELVTEGADIPVQPSATESSVETSATEPQDMATMAPVEYSGGEEQGMPERPLQPEHQEKATVAPESPTEHSVTERLDKGTEATKTPHESSATESETTEVPEIPLKREQQEKATEIPVTPIESFATEQQDNITEATPPKSEQEDKATEAPEGSHEPSITKQQEKGTEAPETHIDSDQQEKATESPETPVDSDQQEKATEAPETPVDSDQQEKATESPETPIDFDQQEKGTEAPETHIDSDQQEKATESPETPVDFDQQEKATDAPETPVESDQEEKATDVPETPFKPEQQDKATEASVSPIETATEQEEKATDVPETQFKPEQQEKATEASVSPIEIATEQEEKATEVPETTLGPSVTERIDTMTEAAGIPVQPSATESSAGPSGTEQDKATEVPETAYEPGQPEQVTAAPETPAQPAVTEQHDKATEEPTLPEHPSATESSEPDATEMPDKAAEVPESPLETDEHDKATEPSATESSDMATKAPSVISGMSQEKQEHVTEIPIEETEGEKEPETPVSEQEPVSSATETPERATDKPEVQEKEHSKPVLREGEEQKTDSPVEQTEKPRPEISVEPSATESIELATIAPSVESEPEIQKSPATEQQELVTGVPDVSKAPEQPTATESELISDEEPKTPTPEPKLEYSETTPYLIELEEHTHKMEDESTTSILDDTATSQPPSLDEQVDEKPSDVTDKPHDVPESEPTSQAPVSEQEAVPTEAGMLDTKYGEPEQQPPVPEKEEQPTAAPESEMPAENEIYTSAPSTDKPFESSSEEPSAPEDEIPSVLTTKQEPLATEATTTTESPKPTTSSHLSEEPPLPEDEAQFSPSGAGYGQEPDYGDEDQAFGPGTCRYGGKVYVSAQQIPRDDPCDFCFCFRSDIICLQQSCPPPIHGCHEEPIQGFCCPRYECPVSMAATLNVTTTSTTTTTTLPPHFLPGAYKGQVQRRGCQIKGHTYKVGEVVRASSGPCLHCTCGGDGQMKCDPKVCTPEPMLRQMIAAAVSAKRRR